MKPFIMTKNEEDLSLLLPLLETEVVCVPVSRSVSLPALWMFLKTANQCFRSVGGIGCVNLIDCIVTTISEDSGIRLNASAHL